MTTGQMIIINTIIFGSIAEYIYAHIKKVNNRYGKNAKKQWDKVELTNKQKIYYGARKPKEENYYKKTSTLKEWNKVKDYRTMNDMAYKTEETYYYKKKRHIINKILIAVCILAEITIVLFFATELSTNKNETERIIILAYLAISFIKIYLLVSGRKKDEQKLNKANEEKTYIDECWDEVNK